MKKTVSLLLVLVMLLALAACGGTPDTGDTSPEDEQTTEPVSTPKPEKDAEPAPASEPEEVPEEEPRFTPAGFGETVALDFVEFTFNDDFGHPNSRMATPPFTGAFPTAWRATGSTGP